MLAGALLAARLTRLMPFGAVIAIGPVAGFFAAVLMVLTIWLPSALLAGLSFFLVGAGPIVWVISTTTLRQTVTPRDLLGRASAISVMAQGSRPVGAALGALLGQLYGAETCLVAASLVFLVQALVILTSPTRRLARQPEPAI
jgi:predicted MFS family arabinose efflux permease